MNPGKSAGMSKIRRDLISESAEDVRQGESSETGLPRSRRDRRREHSLPRPTLFPGMSLAHNFHEIMLGALVNSNGQDLLSSEDIPLKKKSRRHSKRHRDAPGELRKSRQVARIERCERIPTWPVSNGLRCRAVARCNPSLAAKLEHNIGGADCPNLWLTNDDPSTTSPFLMLVHHNHSFDLANPARFVEKEILPEGFPSHAHQGMTTVTISLRGGLIHRDSDGTKQVFGAETSRAKDNECGPYRGKHTQWLTFGKGIVHELMFDNVRKKGQLGQRGSSVLHQELYQIWIDLPNKDRMMAPRVELLGGKESTPVVRRHGTTTTVIAGRHSGIVASVAKDNECGPYRGKHTQWLTFGKGIVHELMFDNVRKKGQLGQRGSSVLHQELYQIWIDLPNKDRMMAPRVELLGGKESTPVVRRHGTTTTVIAGRHSGIVASVAVTSDLTILRVEMGRFSAWQHDVSCTHETMIIYVRTGSILIGGNEVSAHCTAHLSSEGDVLSVEAGPEGADFLLLSGQPLGKRVRARGSMVSDSRAGLEKAFADYERGEIGTPWSERYSDDEWRSHVAKHKRR